MRETKVKITSIIFLLLILGINAYGQDNNIVNSSRVDSVVQCVVAKEISTYKSELNSMKNQIEKYKLNENYYSTALSSQTAIFSLIVAVLFLLIGYISYNKFKDEVNEVTQKYNKSIENYKKIEERLASSDGDLYGILALMCYKEKAYDQAVYYGLSALSHANLCNTEKDTLKGNILSLIVWSENKLTSNNMQHIVEKKEDVFKFLNILTCVLDNDIQIEIAKLRLILTEKINNAS